MSEAQLDFIDNNKGIKALYFDDLLRERKDVHGQTETFLKDLKSPLGLEIDLDSISNNLSSAITPSGFSLNEVRQFLLTLKKNFSYIHICEGAHTLSDGRKDEAIGKTIAYLLSDFVKQN